MASTNSRIKKLEAELEQLRQEERKLQADAMAFYKYGGLLQFKDIQSVLENITYEDWMAVRDKIPGVYTTAHIAWEPRERTLQEQDELDKFWNELPERRAYQLRNCNGVLEGYGPNVDGFRADYAPDESKWAGWSAQLRGWGEGYYQSVIIEMQQLEFNEGYWMDNEGTIHSGEHSPGTG